MKKTENLGTRLRASWRYLLVSLVQLTHRVRAGLGLPVRPSR